MQLTPPSFLIQIVVASSCSIPCFPLFISGNNRHPEETAGVPSLRLSLFVSPTRSSPFYKGTSTTQHYIPLQILIPANPLLIFFSKTRIWALTGSRKEHWLHIASSRRGEGAAVTGRRVLQEEQWLMPFFCRVHIHRDRAMHKHCLRELHPTASPCLMQKPLHCSETFLNGASPWMLCHKRTRVSQGERQECEEFQEGGEIVMCHSHRLRLLSAAFSEQPGCILY